MASTTTDSNPLPILYGYFRSSCSFRVRIVMNWKGIPYETQIVNLLKSEQHSEEYKKVNPSERVPSLKIVSGKDNQKVTLIQSTAIIEYLDEVYPQNPLLPRDNDGSSSSSTAGPLERSKIRAIVSLISNDIQPLQNVGVLNRMSEEERKTAPRDIITNGFKTLEEYLVRFGCGQYSVGDNVTMADAYLLPQVYNGLRYGVDMSQFPLISRVAKNLLELEAFANACPENQADCPDNLKDEISASWSKL
ncbi:hypothetical protein H4219_003377 [Mycoemilia scoparia]|uniref:Maleylacetoacetate isomerase n=1 Tax=Mycoemilia scoparia TaxID=417184 RepID=A0A9W8A1E7_9FUNG|nr:hypothetical protein H4219_003377 [Mycoemilia scoparia]